MARPLYVASLTVVGFGRHPFDVEPRDGQMLRRIVSVGTASFVEAEDRVVGGDGDGQIAVAARAGFEGFVEGPGFAFVVAELEGEVFAVAALAGFGVGC